MRIATRTFVLALAALALVAGEAQAGPTKGRPLKTGQTTTYGAAGDTTAGLSRMYNDLGNGVIKDRSTTGKRPTPGARATTPSTARLRRYFSRRSTRHRASEASATGACRRGSSWKRFSTSATSTPPSRPYSTRTARQAAPSRPAVARVPAITGRRLRTGPIRPTRGSCTSTMATSATTIRRTSDSSVPSVPARDLTLWSLDP